MTLFRETYRIESARKRHWDYSLPGWYFITICTENKKSHFGRITNGAMHFSPVGEHTAGCWREIPAHHSTIEIDEFIVMPNHVHGIIVITGLQRLPELQRSGGIKQVAELSSIHPKANSLGVVVGSFESAVSKWCGLQALEFGWQARFHDRIIRGNSSLKAVREYIRDNPANWHKDTLFVA